MRFSWNAKCKIWSRACRIDSWQKQLCIFITRMSILIFVRVLENSSQRAYFRSCDENTATPLADKREIGGFMGFPVPYWKIWLVCWWDISGIKKEVFNIITLILREHHFFQSPGLFIDSIGKILHQLLQRFRIPCLERCVLCQMRINIKGAGSRNRKPTCYLYNQYCCPHVAIVFCKDFGGWGESTRKLLPKIHQYLCNRKTYECFACFSTKLKTRSSK